jgi:hypothetical protein
MGAGIIYVCMYRINYKSSSTKRRYHGFEVVVNKNISSFNITVDNPRMACTYFSMK